MRHSKRSAINQIANGLFTLATSHPVVRLLVILSVIVIAIALIGGVNPLDMWSWNKDNPVSTQTQSAPAEEQKAEAPAQGNTADTPVAEGTTINIAGHLITVAEEQNGDSYDREANFGDAWAYDLDNNGCDTRNDILTRDLQNPVIDSDGCTVLSGEMVNDPYTGQTYEWTRGRSTSSAVQIDHVIPLKYAWTHGADKWSQEAREQYANDPDILLAADGPANGAKGAKGPSEWEPSNSDYTCTYAEKWIDIASTWNISVSSADAEWLVKTVDDCR